VLPNPLHPAVVHFPIAFAYLLPLVAALGLWQIRRGGSVRAAWIPVAVLMLFTLAAGIVAVRSGGATEDAVEKVVAKRLIHEHEERAESFMFIAWGALVLLAAGFLRGRLGATGRWLFFVASLLLAIQVTWTGKLGGELVYKHGAASAYAQPAAPQPTELEEDSGN
jgi:uncharacterized membrane protein